ncbi:MAG: LacI family DNA-binding transcriptional regulator [Spirochaetales bacterium]|nr:LacI family DNA-binding transcriptional regulator [Spirochaetales bacterium]
MATQKDVAKRAGVSFITVSRVVNGLNNVKEETRRRVEQAIWELKYYPNALGRALNSGRVGTIGVVTPIRMHTDFGADYYLISILNGIEHWCRKNASDLIISTQASQDENPDLLNLYHKRKVDGIVFVGFQRVPSSVINEIHGERIPSVIIADRPSFDDLPWIDTDNINAGSQALEQLLNHGCQRVGVVLHDINVMENLNIWDRWLGIKETIQNRNLKWSEEWKIDVPDLTLDSGAMAFHAWKNLGSNRPDGMICGNDHLAIGFIREALANGIRVPEDVKVIGFDGIPEGRWLIPDLATMVQPLSDMGYLAAEFLEARMTSNAHSTSLTRIMPLTFRNGKSIG